ncbi:MAG: acyl-CoA thioesterase [Hydrogenothermus sp.]|nr:MAG: acyl-CoA thioesterase [Hydrogenothermus sp.]
MKEVIYKRKVNFYETDAQGIVHHSNYPRYFEEARVYFLEKNNFPYHLVRNELNIDIVLLELTVKYRKFLQFGDVFEIRTKVCFENKYYFSFEYEVLKENNIICTGYTKHCCIDRSSKKLKRIPKQLANIINKGKDP